MIRQSASIITTFSSQQTGLLTSWSVSATDHSSQSERECTILSFGTSTRVGAWVRIDHSSRSERECSIQDSSTFVTSGCLGFIVESREFELIHNIDIHDWDLDYQFIKYHMCTTRGGRWKWGGLTLIIRDCFFGIIVRIAWIYIYLRTRPFFCFCFGTIRGQSCKKGWDVVPKAVTLSLPLKSRL